LDTTFCGSDVLVHPEAPRVAELGFPCFDVDFVLRGDGGLVYLYTDAAANSHVVDFVADAFSRTEDGGWTYPISPELNDGLIPTPQCDALGGPNGFILDPETGEVVFNCPGSNDWIDASGDVRVASANPLALGAGHRALVFAEDGGFAVIGSDGGAEGVAGLLPDAVAGIDAARSLADGWWVALDQSLSRQLWHIPFSGPATSVGSYPAFTAQGNEGALSASGSLYLFGLDPSDPSGTAHTIARLDLNGAQAAVVYSDYLAPMDDLGVTPPQIFARTGPTGGKLFSVR
jgi:hypothetical protein